VRVRERRGFETRETRAAAQEEKIKEKLEKIEEKLFFLLKLRPSFLASRGLAARSSRASTAPLTLKINKRLLAVHYVSREHILLHISILRGGKNFKYFLESSVAHVEVKRENITSCFCFLRKRNSAC